MSAKANDKTDTATGPGAVAAGHEVTRQAAIDILRAGGNAVDAAIAAAFCACVSEPVLASPGGGGFASVLKGDEVNVYDFFAQTPRARNENDARITAIEADFGTATQEFHIGPGTSATPGFLAGIVRLKEDAASMAMEDLIAPAIRAAREGVNLSAFQRKLETIVQPILVHTPAATDHFAPAGQIPPVNTRLTNRSLADFLADFASDPSATFGSDLMIASLEGKGHLSCADFDDYKVHKRKPLVLERGGTRIFLNPPAAASGTLIGCMFEQLGRGAGGMPDLVEAMAIIDAAWQDPKSDLAQICARLGPPAWRGTTHISVVDHQASACAITLSNGEGNGHMVEGAGFMVNNMLGEADVNPAGENWPPGTRLSSMMCPAVVKTPGGDVFALGSGGSNRIRTAIFQVLANLIDLDLDPAAAVNAPRAHFESGHLDFEDFLSDADRNTLLNRWPDHRAWPERSMFFGGCHIAGRMGDGRFAGAGDPRRDGGFVVA